MADRLILCSECGTKNRVGNDKAGRPTCGNCGKALTVTGNRGAGLSQFSKSAFWFAFGVVSLAGILQYNNPNFIYISGVLGWFNGQNVVDQATPPDGFVLDDAPLAPAPVKAKPKFLEDAPIVKPAGKKQSDQKPLDFSTQSEQWEDEYIPVTISTGVVRRAKNAVAPLKVKTAKGYNYFVKLVDMKNRTVMTMYIVGGEPFETKVPLGTFEIRYVAGHIWYGEKNKHFFGKPPETIASKADEFFEFSVQQNETETIYSGHTIELILQTNGNLRVDPMSVDDF